MTIRLLLAVIICWSHYSSAANDDQGSVRPTDTTKKITVAPDKEIAPIFDKKRAESIISAVNTVVRETGVSQGETTKGLRSALDVRLPIVLSDCDVKISHEILRIAYGVATDAPESVRVLREISSDFARRNTEEFKGVGRSCAAALKGLGVAVTRVYLGDGWSEK